MGQVRSSACIIGPFRSQVAHSRLPQQVRTTSRAVSIALGARVCPSSDRNTTSSSRVLSRHRSKQHCAVDVYADNTPTCSIAIATRFAGDSEVQQEHELDALIFDRESQLRQIPVVEQLCVLMGRRASYARRSLSPPRIQLHHHRISHDRICAGNADRTARWRPRVHVPRCRFRTAGPPLDNSQCWKKASFRRPMREGRTCQQ